MAINESETIILNRHTVYILPSREGMIYVIIALAMLIGALNYVNNMALAMSFILAGIWLVAMTHTYQNLLGIGVRIEKAAPVFAGQEIAFPVHLSGIKNQSRRTIKLQLGKHAGVVINLDNDQIIMLHQPALSRGWLAMERMRIATVYPLGLFEAWSEIHFDTKALVYPAPTPQVNVLPTTILADSGSGQLQTGKGVDDFAGFRNYQRGDALRRLHWRAFARERGLYTSIFSGWIQQELWLDWNLLKGLEIELRLSQLCRWVLEADNSGINYGLRLPDEEILPNHGIDQRQRCLKALALFFPAKR